MNLHFAGIIVNVSHKETVAVNEADQAGKTPLMLATGRKHHGIIKYLKTELNMKTSFSFLPKLDMG